MASHRSFERGVGVGILWMLDAQAAHWFITPAAHPAAILAQTVGVWAQLIAGLGGGGWMLWRAPPGAPRPRAGCGAGQLRLTRHRRAGAPGAQELTLVGPQSRSS